MKYIEDFSRPHLISHKKLRILPLKRGITVIVCAAIIIIVIVIICLVLFSPFRISLDKAHYYILFLDEADSQDGAVSLADGISKAGGAGYIINDGTFKIAAAVYKTHGDAETVKQRLLEKYGKASIMEINIGKASIKRRHDKKTDDGLKAILNYPIELIDLVIEQNLRIDTSEKTQGEGLLSLSEQYDRLIEIRETLENYSDSEVIRQTYTYYTRLISAWESMTDILSTDGSLTHRMKYFAVEAAHLYALFRQNLV